jgi:hypothetical protein
MSSKKGGATRKSGPRKTNKSTFWVYGGILGLLLALIGFGIWQGTRTNQVLGEDFPIASREHIPDGQKAVDYNSDPPTSGQHYALPAEAGFYNEAPADETLVHNLEHGHVVIYYNCELVNAAECETLKQQIKENMSQAGLVRETRTIKLVAVPRPGMPNLITYTSWGRLYRANALDPNEFQLYVSQNRNRAAPEPLAE